MKFSVLVLSAILVSSLLLSLAPASGAPDVVYDNWDPAQAKEWPSGDVFIDAVSLEVDGNGTHLFLTVNAASAMPVDDRYEWKPYFYLDTDSDGDDEYYVSVSCHGANIFPPCNLQALDLDTNTPFIPTPYEIYFTPGGTSIGAAVPYSAFGLSPGDTVGVRVEFNSFAYDDVSSGWNSYTLNGNTAVTVDGDSSEWAGVPVMFDDGDDGITPAEFDWAEFYTTDNATAASGQAISHMVTLQANPTTVLNPGSMWVYRHAQWIEYDVDGDTQADYRLQVGYGLRAYSSGSNRLVFYWFQHYDPGTSSWVTDYFAYPASGWDWGPALESSIPLSWLGVASGDTINVRVSFGRSLSSIDDIPTLTESDHYAFVLPAPPPPPGPAVGGRLAYSRAPVAILLAALVGAATLVAAAIRRRGVAGR